MATKTPNLGLIKPAQGEFQGNWNVPLNKNADLTDAAISDIQYELEAARGLMGSLDARLSGVVTPDGNPTDNPEIAVARSSTVYGSDLAGTSFQLDDRIEKGDREVFDAREQAPTLLDGRAASGDDFVHNSILSAPALFLGATGNVVRVDGSVAPIIVNINGYRQVVRTLKNMTIPAGTAAGTLYLYLQRNPSGEVILDRTTGTNSGACGIDSSTNKLNKFSDTTQSFVTSGVQPGDILEITSTGSHNLGQYIVDKVIDANTVLIIGLFSDTQATLSYKITNPLSPTLGFSATPHSKRWQRESGLIYIGRVVFDGTNVTSFIPYSARGRFEQFVSVSLSAGVFNQTISHNLGYVPRTVRFYASQANDYSQAIEPLSVGDMTSSTLLRSVICDLSDMTLRVKNSTNGLFYKSFDGVSQTTGYLLVIAER